MRIFRAGTLGLFSGEGGAGTMGGIPCNAGHSMAERPPGPPPRGEGIDRQKVPWHNLDVLVVVLRPDQPRLTTVLESKGEHLWHHLSAPIWGVRFT